MTPAMTPSFSKRSKQCQIAVEWGRRALDRRLTLFFLPTPLQHGAVAQHLGRGVRGASVLWAWVMDGIICTVLLTLSAHYELICWMINKGSNRWQAWTTAKWHLQTLRPDNLIRRWWTRHRLSSHPPFSSSILPITTRRNSLLSFDSNDSIDNVDSKYICPYNERTTCAWITPALSVDNYTFFFRSHLLALVVSLFSFMHSKPTGYSKESNSIQEQEYGWSFCDSREMVYYDEECQCVVQWEWMKNAGGWRLKGYVRLTRSRNQIKENILQTATAIRCSKVSWWEGENRSWKRSRRDERKPVESEERRWERMYLVGNDLHSSHGHGLHVSHVGLDEVGLESFGGHNGVLVDSSKVGGGEVDRGTGSLRGGVGSRGGLVLLGGGRDSVELEEGHCGCML